MNFKFSLTDGEAIIFAAKLEYSKCFNVNSTLCETKLNNLINSEWFYKVSFA